jgi:hypothetical protein
MIVSVPRYFTLLQAEQLLPSVEQAIREAIALKAEYQDAETKIQKATQRIVMLGGSMGSRDLIAGERERRNRSGTALNAAIERIQEFGCQVKDLDTGLIDFPTLYRGREVLLCWKLGETGISYWHGLEDGFRGRKPVDEDFLQNHRGADSPQ